MRVRGKGESSSILRLKCIIYLCVFLSQFQRFQTELEDELGDDVQVVSADQQGSLSFLYKFSRPSLIQVGTSTPGITGYFEVEVGGQVVHSKKVT